MFVRLVSSFVLLVCCNTFAQATVSAERVQLGDQRPGQRLSAKVRVENDSGVAVKMLRQTQHVTERVHATHLPLTVPAHGSVELQLDVYVDRLLGSQAYFADFDLDGEQKTLRVNVKLFVDSAIDGEPTTMDFGLVAAEEQAERRVDFASRDLPALRAQSAEDKSKLVNIEIVDGGKSLTLRTRRDAPWGKHEGWIEVATTSKVQPTAWVKYSFETRGRVVPESYNISAGIQRVGKVQAQALFLRDTENGVLELGKITQRGAPVIVSVADCPVKSVSCRALEVKVDDEKLKDAKFSTELSIELPQYKQNLVVNYFGRILPPDSKITDMNEQMAAQVRDGAEQHDLSAAIKAVTRPEPAPIMMSMPEGKGPLLKWSVENEQQIYGYIIYRADDENGELRRVNEKIIRTLSREDNVPVKYYWRDTTAQLGRTYWYQIGTVNQHDIRRDLTTRVKKVYTSDAVNSK